MLPALQAEQQLLAFEASSVPHMKDSARTSLIDRYQRRLAGGVIKARSAVEALGAAGIPTRLVPSAKGAAGQAGTTPKAGRG